MAWTNPRTWVAGEKPSAATFNTHIRDNFKAIGDAWTTYTGGDTNVTVGNGTLTKRYMQAGKMVKYSIELTFGSTTAFTGSPRLGLPTTPAIATNFSPKGQATLFDASGGQRFWHVIWVAANNGVVPADDSGTGVAATTPWTWTTGDQIIINGDYEAA